MGSELFTEESENVIKDIKEKIIDTINEDEVKITPLNVIEAIYNFAISLEKIAPQRSKPLRNLIVLLEDIKKKPTSQKSTENIPKVIQTFKNWCEANLEFVRKSKHISKYPSISHTEDTGVRWMILFNDRENSDEIHKPIVDHLQYIQDLINNKPSKKVETVNDIFDTFAYVKQEIGNITEKYKEIFSNEKDVDKTISRLFDDDDIRNDIKNTVISIIKRFRMLNIDLFNMSPGKIAELAMKFAHKFGISVPQKVVTKFK